MSKIESPLRSDKPTDPGVDLEYGGLPLWVYLPIVVGMILFAAIMLYING